MHRGVGGVRGQAIIMMCPRDTQVRMIGTVLAELVGFTVRRDLAVNTWHSTQPGRLMGLTAWQQTDLGSLNVIGLGQIWTLADSCS